MARSSVYLTTTVTCNQGTPGVTAWPVSLATCPLPSGAATETTLAALSAKITACNTGAVAVTSCALPTGAATSAAQATGNASLASIDGKITACNTGAVTVVSSALPTGAATDAMLTGGTAKTIVRGGAKGATAAAEVTSTSIDADHAALDVAVKAALPAGANTIGKVDQGAGGASAWKVDGSGATQPVSGSVTAGQGAPAAVGAPWYVRLSDGAAAISVALDATVQAVRDRLPAAFGSGGGVKIDGSGTALPVSGSVTATISGTPAVTVASGAVTETNSASILARLTADPSTATLQTTGNTSASTTATNTATLAGTVAAGKVGVSCAQLPAALGQAARAASTSVALSTEDAAKVPALGQALAAVCSPVVLPAAQDVVAYAGSANRLNVTLTSATTQDASLPTGMNVHAGVGKDAAPTAVADGNSVRAWFQRNGARVTTLVDSAGALYTAAKDATLTGGTQIAIAKGAAATGAAVSGNPVYVGGKDGSGNAQPVLVSAAGNVQTSAAKGTTVSSTAAEASRVISASACMAARASMYNGNAATRYMQLHNATSLPANGAVPSSVLVIGTTQTQVATFPIPTDRFSTGCVIANSSTGATLTVGAADSLFTVDLFPANT